MTENEEAALRVAKRYRRQVDLLEDETARKLARRYTAVSALITAEMKKLEEKDDRPLIFRFRQLILPGIIVELERYTRETERTMLQLTKQTARLGVESADASARKVSNGSWQKVNTAGLFTGGIFDASRSALQKIPSVIADRLTDLVTQAQGMAEQGFEWLQSQIGDILSGAWSGIQRVIRTVAEQMFRKAQQKQREQMPVQQWRRCANHQTACLACLMLEGTFYDRAEDFSDHPNGRCYIIPVEPGSQPDHAGRDWLEAQDEETQRKIMGKTRFEAWQNGDLTLDQMTDVVPNAEFGPQPHVIPLKDLGLTPAK